jgi:hypothetical protein
MRSRSTLSLRLALLALCLGLAAASHAADGPDAETSARLLAAQIEKDGFEFRADSWTRELDDDAGKAMRLQLFKGNDYRFVVAVPRKSGVFVTGAVLDLDGQPAGEIQPVLEGWGCVLSFKPKKTGTYVIVVRQTKEGKSTDVPCVVVTGYK